MIIIKGLIVKISPFFMFYIFRYSYLFLITVFLFCDKSFSQEIDVDGLLEKIERIERNISDLQKGKIGDLDKKLAPGYISRNESRLDKIETKNRMNYGIVEEIQNKLQTLEKKLDLINVDFQSRIIEIEKKIENISNGKIPKVEKNIQSNNDYVESPIIKEVKTLNEKELINNNEKNEVLNLDEKTLKKKYENAIKLLWASKYEEAKKELLELKEFEPKDLMPNIQYWLGEVYYAQQDFKQAVVEFGEGLEKYPESIKGPDSMLKLGLSFSNMKQKDDACNVLYALEIRYNNSSKNVLERASSERKKLNCPKE